MREYRDDRGPSGFIDYRLVIPACAAWVCVVWSLNLSIASHALVCAMLTGIAALAGAVSFFRPPHARHADMLAASPGAAIALCAIVAAVCSLSSLWQRSLIEADPLHEWARNNTADVTVWGRLDGQPTLLSRSGDRPRISKDSIPNMQMATLDAHSFALPNATTMSATALSVRIMGPGWEEVKPGERVRIVVDLSLRSGQAAIAGYARSKPVVEGGAQVADKLAQRVRESVSQTAKPYSPAQRSLMPAMVVGDKSSMDPHLSQAMRQVSLSHLAVVSGLHVSIVMGAVGVAASWMKPAPRMAVCAGALMGYMVLTGMGPSVVRAGIMGAIAMFAQVAKRPSRALTSLAVAVVAMIALDAYAAISYSFMLSVAATAAIVMRSRPWALRLNSIMPRFLADAISVPLVAQVWCTPIIMMFQQGVALYGIAANIAAAPVVPVLMASALGGCLLRPLSFFYIVQWAGDLLLGISDLCCRWIAAIAFYCSQLPGATIPWVQGPWGAVAFIIVAACFHAIVVVYEPGLGMRNWLRSRRERKMRRASSLPGD